MEEIEYYRGRLAKALAAAEDSKCAKSRECHRELAVLYSEHLAHLEGGRVIVLMVPAQAAA